jgi:hypothetical protein
MNALAIFVAGLLFSCSAGCGLRRYLASNGTKRSDLISRLNSGLRRFIRLGRC